MLSRRPWTCAAFAILLAPCLAMTCPTDPGAGSMFPRTTAWTGANVEKGANALPNIVNAFDFNGDGLIDVAAGFPGGDGATAEIAIFFQVNVTNWQRVVIVSGNRADGVNALAIGDISGDGRADIVAATSSGLLFLRSGENPVTPGQWAIDTIAQSTGNGIGDWTDVKIAQIDGLFGNDIVACNADPGRLSWFRAPEIVVLGNNWTRLDIDTQRRSNAEAILLEDLDKDSRLDIISTASGEQQQTIVWYQHPGGAVDPADEWMRFPIGNLPSATQIALGDVDRDGRPDVVAVSPTARRVGWYKQPANLITGTWVGASLADFTTNRPVDIKIADLDVNGQLDVVVGTANQGSLRWFTPVNDVNARWIESNLADFSANVSRFVLVDVDLDARPDVIVPLTFANAADDAITWFRNPEN